jgi:hypothetical protein
MLARCRLELNDAYAVGLRAVVARVAHVFAPRGRRPSSPAQDQEPGSLLGAAASCQARTIIASFPPHPRCKIIGLRGNVSSIGGCNLLSIAIVAPVQDAAAQDPVGGAILGGAGAIRRRGRLFGLPFLRGRP